MTSSPLIEKHCSFCGSHKVIQIRYLRKNSTNHLRNLAYAIPTPIAEILLRFYPKLFKMLRQVIANKKVFSGAAIYCPTCRTGLHLPKLSDKVLAKYYETSYWNNRDENEGIHLQQSGVPHKIRERETTDMYNWINESGVSFSSVADVGAGDCAASYFFKKQGLQNVYVVDPSLKSREVAHAYGVKHSFNFDGNFEVDLVFASHIVEHVGDINHFIKNCLSILSKNGYLFYETPNIGDEKIFKGLVHTPHTYFLSEQSFINIEKNWPLRIVKMESCGPLWNSSFPHIKSNMKSDLRVLFQKLD